MAAAKQLVFFLYILMLVSITVSDGVFKLINSSVQLDVQTKGYQFLDFTWTFNKSNNIVKHYKNSPSIVFPDYKDRVELNEKTHSLTLKNLQKSDSGLYEAIAAFNQNLNVAKYQLYVLDPVEEPVLNVSPQQSNDACNVTLTCEAQKLSITSHCYNDTCDLKEEKTAGDAFLSLSLYISNGFIICNHSNPVSWKNTSMEMKQLCHLEEDKKDLKSDKTVIITVPSLIGILFLIFIVILVIHCYKKSTTMDCGNTVYEEVKGEKKAQSVEMSEIPETPGTVYCTVGKPAQACSNGESTVSTANPGTKEMDPNHSNIYDTPDKNQEAGGNYEAVEVTLPQTIYATVNKPGKHA